MRTFKQFTENQAYLTEPYDSEMSVSHKIDYKGFKDSVFNQIELIAKKYELFFNREPDLYYMSIDNKSKYLKFVFELIDDSIYLDVINVQRNESIYYDKNDIESIENTIKEFFKI